MTNSTLEKVTKNIKELRLEQNISQEKLSELAGVSTDYVSLIERGKRVPSLKRLCMIAKVLNVEPYVCLSDFREAFETKRASLF